MKGFPGICSGKILFFEGYSATWLNDAREGMKTGYPEEAVILTIYLHLPAQIVFSCSWFMKEFEKQKG